MFLKHNGTVRSGFGNFFSVDCYFAGSRCFKTGNQVQKRCFSAAGSSDNADKLAGLNLQINILQSRFFTVAELFAEIFYH